jgi:hypothetical protein
MEIFVYCYRYSSLLVDRFSVLRGIATAFLEQEGIAKILSQGAARAFSHSSYGEMACIYNPVQEKRSTYAGTAWN